MISVIKEPMKCPNITSIKYRSEYADRVVELTKIEDNRGRNLFILRFTHNKDNRYEANVNEGRDLSAKYYQLEKRVSKCRNCAIWGSILDQSKWASDIHPYYARELKVFEDIIKSKIPYATV